MSREIIRIRLNTFDHTVASLLIAFFRQLIITCTLRKLLFHFERDVGDGQRPVRLG